MSRANKSKNKSKKKAKKKAVKKPIKKKAIKKKTAKKKTAKKKVIRLSTFKASGNNPIKAGFVVPGLPHYLLQPEKNKGWQDIRNAMDAIANEIKILKPDVLIIYSTYWASVIGHQVQARKNPEWTHVDELFHEMGSIPYKFKMDQDFAEDYVKTGNQRGLHMRTVDYHGFPIDTGSVVTLKLVNPNNEVPATIVSSNIYSDRAETVVLGKSVYETLVKEKKTAVAIAVTSLSNRVLPFEYDPAEDHIFSKKDEEWNQKILEYLSLGRLEDVSQLSRQVHREARVHKVNNFKAFWWLSAVMGQHNRYKGEIMAYAPVQGIGAAAVKLIPTDKAARDLEYDEEDPQVYQGERNVLEQSL